MTKEERLLRVARICFNFARNMAYYRAAREDGRKFSPANNFWNTVDGNFIDIAVLEWCKVFGDRKAHHYWKSLVQDPVAFEKGLLLALNLELTDFDREIDVIRAYRDKFVAHLDSDREGFIPHLDPMWRAVSYCYNYIARNEFSQETLRLITLESIEDYFALCSRDARLVFRAVADSRP